MDFKCHSFRHAEVILNQPDFIEEYKSIKSTIKDISEENIINKHNYYLDDAKRRSIKDKKQLKGPISISKAINNILKERLEIKGWKSESLIFQGDEYVDPRWRLDFAKKDISIEVAFNHGEAVAWNLVKPVLAGELNHVKKEIQTKIGIVITATKELKKHGGFDGAIGEYEKFLRYLPIMQNMLTIPILLIGLEAPKTFSVASRLNKIGIPNGKIFYKRN